jgi:cyanate lyase
MGMITRYQVILGVRASAVAPMTVVADAADPNPLRVNNSDLIATAMRMHVCFDSMHETNPISPQAVTAALMAAKKAKGLSFADLEREMGRDEVWIASLFYGQSAASAEEAEALGRLLDLEPSLIDALQTYPTKGSLDPVLPTDPLIYRFYEIMQVYGMPLKDVIQEKFGDGIMSAIDFTLDVEKVVDPAGDRVKVIMCGKFLPYKKW